MTPQAQNLWDQLQGLEAAITANNFTPVGDIALQSDIVALKKQVVTLDQHLANVVAGNAPDTPLNPNGTAVVPAVG